MWVVLILIAIVIFVNYFLGFKLYKEPKNTEYFHNVNNINTIKMPEIAPSPQYVLVISVLTGILIGMFIVFTQKLGESSIYSLIFSLVIGILYIIEISRRIKLTENALCMSKAFSKAKLIPLNEINGIYIYSPNKKFIDGYAFTTKLVVATRSGNVKFTISSLSKKAILNMMKGNFGVTNCKIYISNK